MHRYDENHRSYTSDPAFPAVEAKAKANGYRKASAGEVRASAERTPWAPDLFCAYGGLWVKETEPHNE